MLLHLNSGVKTLRRIIRKHRNIRLHQDLTTIHAFIDIMDRTPRLLDTCLQSLLPSLNTRERGQQSRMDIQDPPRESLQQRSLNQTHKTCETNEIHLQRLKKAGHTGLLLQRELILKPGAIEQLRPHPMLPGAFQNISVLMVRQNDHDLSIQATISNSIKDRLAITSGSRAQNSYTKRHNSGKFTHVPTLCQFLFKRNNKKGAASDFPAESIGREPFVGRIRSNPSANGEFGRVENVAIPAYKDHGAFPD